MEINLPYRFSPRPYQLPFVRAFEESKFKRYVLVWHRRSGKDKTCMALLPQKMFEKVAPYYYFAPTYSQGKKIFWDGIDRDGMRFRDHFPKEIIAKTNDSEMKIDLVNGSFIQVIGTDNVDRIVGTNPFGCVFTEFSLQQRKAWEYIRPILAENGGWAVFVFTPRGMNHAHEILQTAKNDPTHWFSEVLTVNDTGVIDKSILNDESKEMPKDLFEQEYYCKFIEGAGSFFKNVDECTKVIHPTTGVMVPWTGNLTIDPTHRYRIGADWAKINDYTVITPIDLQTFRVGKQDRFNQIDYNLQKAKLEAHYLRYNKALVRMDSTGLGEPIFDDLQPKIQHLEPFKFTEQTRKDLLTNLQVLLEQRKITIPNDEILLGELRSMQYVLRENGRIGIACPEGVHDDCVMSLALAVWNLPSEPMQPVKTLTADQLALIKQFDANKNKIRILRHG